MYTHSKTGGIVLDLKKEQMDAERDARENRISTEPSLIPPDNLINLDVLNQQLLNCRLNHAACQLKLGDFKSVIGTTTLILDKEPKCIKALFRRGQALLNIGRDLELVRKDFDAVEGLIEGGSAEWNQLQQLRKILDVKSRANVEKEKMMYAGKLFQ